jgi:hypothetical protein
MSIQSISGVADNIWGKIKAAGSVVADGVQEAGSGVKDGALYVGGKAKAAGGKVADAGRYVINNPGQVIGTAIAYSPIGLILGISGCGSVLPADIQPTDVGTNQAQPKTVRTDLGSGWEKMKDTIAGGARVPLGEHSFTLTWTGFADLKHIWVSFYFDNRQAAAFLAADQQGCRALPKVAGVAVEKSMDGTPHVVVDTVANVLYVYCAVDEDVVPGARTASVTSGGQAYSYAFNSNYYDPASSPDGDILQDPVEGSYYFVIDDAAIVNAYESSGGQITVINSASDVCNFTQAQIETLTTGVSGLIISDWDKFTPDGRTLFSPPLAQSAVVPVEVLSITVEDVQDPTIKGSVNLSALALANACTSNPTYDPLNPNSGPILVSDIEASSPACIFDIATIPELAPLFAGNRGASGKVTGRMYWYADAHGVAEGKHTYYGHASADAIGTTQQ